MSNQLLQKIVVAVVVAIVFVIIDIDMIVFHIGEKDERRQKTTETGRISIDESHRHVFLRSSYSSVAKNTYLDDCMAIFYEPREMLRRQ